MLRVTPPRRRASENLVAARNRQVIHPIVSTPPDGSKTDETYGGILATSCQQPGMGRGAPQRASPLGLRESERVKLLFLHGWHSVVGGEKPTYLKAHGYDVINPSLDDDDFELAVRTGQAEYDHHRPDVIVGSSRGGAVAMNIQSTTTPLVLLCPAWKKWGCVTAIKSNSLILHSPQDDVVPFEDSVELIHNSKLPLETIIEVGNDHRLADESSLSVMLWACNLLRSGLQMPAIHDDPKQSFPIPGDSQAASQDEGSYICDACGEEIVIPIDLTQGTTQSYVEDCPVCCRANIVHVLLEEDGKSQVWAEPEQDYS
jgi:hypothetical protein